MNKKRVGICVCLVLVICVLGFLFYNNLLSNKNSVSSNDISSKNKNNKKTSKDNVSNKKDDLEKIDSNSKTNESNEESTSKDSFNINYEMSKLDDEEVLRLYKLFSVSNCFASVDSLNNSNVVKLRIAFNSLDDDSFNDISCSKLSLNSLDSNDISYCGNMNSDMSSAYSVDMELFKKYEKENTTKYVSEDIITKRMHELFGSDFNVIHESFGTGHTANPECSYMKYDSSNKLYAQFRCQGGGTCGGGEIINGYSKTDDAITINTQIEKNNLPVNITYKFKKDKVNGKYVFDRVYEN